MMIAVIPLYLAAWATLVSGQPLRQQGRTDTVDIDLGEWSSIIFGNRTISVETEVPDAAILGGTNSNPYPWFVLIELGSQQICGGTMIQRDVVLTAASCVDGVTNLNPGCPNYVRVGGNSPTTGSVVGVTQGSCRVHPEWTSSNRQAPNLAIFRLDGVLGYPDGYAQLNRDGEIPSGGSLWVGGLGFTTTADNSYPQFLQTAYLNYVPNCGDQYSAYEAGKTICAAASTSGATCKGDTGGPAMLPSTKVIAGVISWRESSTCQTSGVVGFTRVSTYYPWIFYGVCQLSRFADPNSSACNIPTGAGAPAPGPQPTEAPRPESAPTPDCIFRLPFQDQVPALASLSGAMTTQVQAVKNWWNGSEANTNIDDVKAGKMKPNR